MTRQQADSLYRNWTKAVARARDWEDHP